MFFMLNPNSTRPAANNSNGRPASSHETGTWNPNDIIATHRVKANPDGSYTSEPLPGNDEGIRRLVNIFERDGTLQSLNEIRLSYIEMAYYLNELNYSSDINIQISVHPHQDTVNHLFLLGELISYFNEVEA
jgi:hypothetical protein